MPTAQVVKTLNWDNGTKSYAENTGAITFDSPLRWELSLAALVAAQTGTLTTRTDDDTGVATLSTGHGLTTGDICDVYWATGVRYGMEATVATNAVTLDGGAGDNLPIQDTAVTVAEQQIHAVPLDGDEADFVAVVYENALAPTAKAHVHFQDASNDSIAEVDLVHYSANGGLDQVINIAGGDTNIYTGDPITHVHVSHNSTQAATIVIMAGVESA